MCRRMCRCAQACSDVPKHVQMCRMRAQGCADVPNARPRMCRCAECGPEDVQMCRMHARGCADVPDAQAPHQQQRCQRHMSDRVRARMLLFGLSNAEPYNRGQQKASSHVDTVDRTHKGLRGPHTQRTPWTAPEKSCTFCASWRNAIPHRSTPSQLPNSECMHCVHCTQTSLLSWHSLEQGAITHPRPAHACTRRQPQSHSSTCKHPQTATFTLQHMHASTDGYRHTPAHACINRRLPSHSSTCMHPQMAAVTLQHMHASTDGRCHTPAHACIDRQPPAHTSRGRCPLPALAWRCAPTGVKHAMQQGMRAHAPWDGCTAS